MNKILRFYSKNLKNNAKNQMAVLGHHTADLLTSNSFFAVLFDCCRSPGQRNFGLVLNSDIKPIGFGGCLFSLGNNTRILCDLFVYNSCK